jgi:hypothetical protein
MTWENITDTIEGGNGVVEYRLEIEGFDYSFVTNIGMVNNSTYPKRIPGMLREGLNFEESIMLPQAKLKLNGNTFKIVDFQKQATKAFVREPTTTIFLMNNVSKGQSAMIVSDVGAISSQVGNYFWIGSEVIKLLGIISSTRKEISVARGQLGTTPLAHFALTDLGVPIRPKIKNSYSTIERRRVKLYAYGTNDSLQGDGTIIWRGVVNQSVFEKGVYSIQCGPVTDVLKSSMGVDMDDLKLRGINFGRFVWTISMQNLNGNDIVSASYLNSAGATISASGFYNDKWALVQDLNNQAVTASRSWPTKANIQLAPNGEILFCQTQTNANRAIKFASVYVRNLQPTTTISGLPYFNIYNPNFVFEVNQTTGLPIDTTATGRPSNTLKTYASRLKARPFPDQFMTYASNEALQVSGSYLTTAQKSLSKRFYLSAPQLPNQINQIDIYDEDNNLLGFNHVENPITVNVVDRYIQGSITINNCDSALDIINNNCKIVAGTNFGQRTNLGTGLFQGVAQNLYDFIYSLLYFSPQYCNNGTIPLITSKDFDYASILDVFKKLPVTPFVRDREYVFVKKSTSLEDYLNEEYKLLGVVPALSADGRMTITRLRNITPYETPEYTITAKDILTDNSFISKQENEFGIWNSVEIKTGYNPIKTQWEGTTYVQNNLESIADYNNTIHQVKIAPYSRTRNNAKIVPNDIAELEAVMRKATSMFDSRYTVYTIEVPMKYFNVRLGSTALIQSKQIPNIRPDYSNLETRYGTGKLIGLVVGKSFDLSKGFGKIKVFCNNEPWQGLSPNVTAVYPLDGLITSTPTSLGTSLYSVTMNTVSSSYFNGPESHEEFWNVGDGIKFEQWDSSTLNTGTGQIKSITGNGNTLTFKVYLPSAPSGFTTSGRTWHFSIPDANSFYCTNEQKKYAFIDGGYTEGRVNYPGTLSRLISF